VRIDADGRPLALVEVTAGHPPQRLALDLGAAQRLRIRATGGSAVVLGNARVYARRASPPRSTGG
jgi:predicted pyridoxine 5'-phosphate oxidase superfamily flavin-nucleotide-binding protein